MANFVESISDQFGATLGTNVLNIVSAALILVIGLIIATIIAKTVRKLLSSTDIDHRLAQWVSGSQNSSVVSNVEKWVETSVFWLIMLLVIVAALNALQLAVVTQPLNTLLNQVLGYLPQLGAAAVLLIVALVVATIAKMIVVRGLKAFNLDEQLNSSTASGSEASAALPLSETLGNAVYGLIVLLFLLGILGTLGLNGPLAPIQSMVGDIFGFFPNLLIAGVLGFVGWTIAKIVRMIVSNLLQSAGADQFGAKFGIGQASRGRGLSWIGGTFAYVVILVAFATTVLDALKIRSISEPASNMIDKVTNALPNILTAVGLLAFGYVIGKLIGELVTNVLTSVGFNNIFQWLGFDMGGGAATPASETSTQATPEPSAIPDSGATVLQVPSSPIRDTEPVGEATRKTPSEIVGIATWVGIIALIVLPATQILQFSSLTAVVEQLLQIAGQVLIGAIIFSVGLYLANLAFSLISSSGGAQARLVGQAARVSILALVTAMALQQIGLAPSIVNLAFGLLLGAVAIALAVAFGFGSIDIAGEQVRTWLSDFKQKD